MAAPPRDWRVCKQLFAEPWNAFPHAHPRYQTWYDEGVVAQRLASGHPEQMGSLASRCPQCGPGKPRVSRRCQASWCWRCATGSVAHWGRQVSQGLHAGGSSRHLILTVPALVRTPFSPNAAVVLRAWMRCGGQGREASRAPSEARRSGGLHRGAPHAGPHRSVPSPSAWARHPWGADGQGARWEPRHAWP